MATYIYENHSISRQTKDGVELLCNFDAEIIEETKYSDGEQTNTVLTIAGRNQKKTFPTVKVPAEKFTTLGWVMSAWGSAAVILPGASIKEDLRAAIQLKSKPKMTTIYTHTGYHQISKEWVYLHAGGAVTRRGINPAIKVQLPKELSLYALTVDRDPMIAIESTLNLANLAPKKIMWPLIAAIFSPLHGQVDFAIHLTGRTGTFKSELASIIGAHYGRDIDARHLPGSWSSTANALEAQAYRLKNAVFVVDDFIPIGTSWQLRAYQKTADQLIRGQGNQTGRARLTDASSMQTTMFPRGLILSTGEDTPDGHSVRARMLILDITPGDIDPGKLSEAQYKRDLYCVTTASYLQFHLSDLKERQANFKARQNQLRDEFITIGHSRTPSTIAHLIASVEAFLLFAHHKGVLTEKDATQAKFEALNAILQTGDEQNAFLTTTDPIEIWNETIRNMLAGHICHIRTLSGGIPANPTILGWTKEETLGDLPTYKAHGKKLGWINWNAGELCLDAGIAYNEIRKHAGGQIQMTRQTLFKRLKDASQLVRIDETRQRNTVRITAEGHTRQVLILSIPEVLQTQEIPNA